MDNEMIERVAKEFIAIEPSEARRERLAKEVIKAMREPTHNMKLNNAKYDQSSNELWQSMIDAIINE